MTFANVHIRWKKVKHKFCSDGNYKAGGELVLMDEKIFYNTCQSGMGLVSQYEQIKAFTSIYNEYIYKDATGAPKKGF